RKHICKLICQISCSNSTGPCTSIDESRCSCMAGLPCTHPLYAGRTRLVSAFVFRPFTSPEKPYAVYVSPPFQGCHRQPVVTCGKTGSPAAAVQDFRVTLRL